MAGPPRRLICKRLFPPGLAPDSLATVERRVAEECARERRLNGS